MSSYPLPALDIKPQQEQNPLDQYSKLVQLKSMLNQQQQEAALRPLQVQQAQQQVQAGQQQNQLNQYKIQDAQAGMQAMKQWDGKNIDELPELIRKNGGSLDAVTTAQQSILKQKSELQGYNKAQLDMQATKNDYLLGKLQTVTDGQSLLKAAQEAVNDGYLDPQHAQQLQQMAQGDPETLKNQLSIFEKGLMGQKEQFAQEQKNRETAAAEQTAQARSTSAQTSANEFQQKMPGGALYAPTIAAQEAQAKQPIDVQTEVQKQKAIQSLNPTPLANVKPNLVAPAAAAAQKAGEAFTQAQQAADDMKSMVDLAKQGNKIAYAYSPVTGVLQINVAGQTKRINTTEIEQYGGAGSALDRIKGFLGKQESGASIPENILQDMGTVSQSYLGNAQKKYDADLKLVDRNYGSSFSGGKSQSAFKIPDGAPSAQGLSDGHKLKDAKGNVLAISQGGQWVAPPSQ